MFLIKEIYFSKHLNFKYFSSCNRMLTGIHIFADMLKHIATFYNNNVVNLYCILMYTITISHIFLLGGSLTSVLTRSQLPRKDYRTTYTKQLYYVKDYRCVFHHSDKPLFMSK